MPSLWFVLVILLQVTVTESINMTTFTLYTTPIVTWQSAVTFCRSQGQELVRLTSQAEQDFITSKYKSSQLHPKIIWSSLHDPNSGAAAGGGYQWQLLDPEDCQTLETGAWQMWDADEPQKDLDKRCVQMHWSDTGYLWRTADCNTRLTMVICRAARGFCGVYREMSGHSIRLSDVTFTKTFSVADKSRCPEACTREPSTGTTGCYAARWTGGGDQDGNCQLFIAHQHFATENLERASDEDTLFVRYCFVGSAVRDEFKVPSELFNPTCPSDLSYTLSPEPQPITTTTADENTPQDGIQAALTPASTVRTTEDTKDSTAAATSVTSTAFTTAASTTPIPTTTTSTTSSTTTPRTTITTSSTTAPTTATTTTTTTDTSETITSTTQSPDATNTKTSATPTDKTTAKHTDQTTTEPADQTAIKPTDQTTAKRTTTAASTTSANQSTTTPITTTPTTASTKPETVATPASTDVTTATQSATFTTKTGPAGVTTDTSTIVSTSHIRQNSSGTTFVSPTTSPTGPQASTLCACYTCNRYTRPNITAAQQDVLANLLKTLTVDPKNTAINKRKYVSAPDRRASAQTIGWLGITVLASVFGVIVAFDASALWCSRLQKEFFTKWPIDMVKALRWPITVGEALNNKN